MAAAQIELSRFPAVVDDARSDERQLAEEDFGPSQTDANLTGIPPPDRGRAAYLFLLACFMVEALVWGFAFSFGIFQEYYTREFAGQPNIAVIGTCCMVSHFGYYSFYETCVDLILEGPVVSFSTVRLRCTQEMA